MEYEDRKLNIVENKNEKSTALRTRIPGNVHATRCRTPRSSNESHYFGNSGDAKRVNILLRNISIPHLNDAVEIFLSDVIIPLPNGVPYNGHLTNLKALAQSCSADDVLPVALEAVALASFAKRLGHRSLQIEALRKYALSIRRLRNVDWNSRSNFGCSIAAVFLMNLFEIVNASVSSGSTWLQHFYGLVAALKHYVAQAGRPVSGIPLLLLASEKPNECYENVPDDKNLHYDRVHGDPVYSNMSIKRLQPLGVTYPFQSSRPYFDKLCLTLPKVQALFHEVKSLLEPQSLRLEATIQVLRARAIALKTELLCWSASQPATARPNIVRRFTQPYSLRFPHMDDLTCWALRADAYCDFFEACMWNTYRQCQLHLTNLVDRLSQMLSSDQEVYGKSREHLRLCKESHELVEDVCASIPFMLVGPAITGCNPQESTWAQTRPPKIVGGLSLQWVLFAISILDIVPQTTRHNMKKSLFWIGRNLGIGQADVLSQMDQNIPGGITAKGDVLKWIGFLV